MTTEKTVTAVEKEEPFNRKAFLNECKAMKKLLDKEPKKKVRLPLLKDKNALNYVPVCINGYIYQVKRGVEVEVPDYVAEVLKNSMKQDQYALGVMEELQKGADW